MNNHDLIGLVRAHPEVEALTRVIGLRPVLNGFENEEVVVIATYLYECIPYKVANSRADDVYFIYTGLGGSYTDYNGACVRAERSKYVNLDRDNENKVCPHLSSVKGIEKLDQLLSKSATGETRIIKEGETFTAKPKFEGILRSYLLPSDVVLFVDPYFSSGTLDFLTPILGSTKALWVLTTKIQSNDENSLKRDIERFEKQGGLAVEVRKNKELHDRFILSDKGGWSMGQSLKDLGKKDSIMTNVMPIRETLLDLLKERWEHATVWK